MADTLQVGVARATITPPVGIDMIGFAGRGPSTGIHDDLYATALVAVRGDTKAALISCDLLGLKADRVADIRAEVARRTGIPAGNVMVSCTHTHYGPSVGMEHHPEPDANVTAYVQLLPHLLAGAVQEAAANLKPARIGVGRGTCGIGINRRERKPDGSIVLGHNPGGAIDRELIVVRIDGDSGPLATLVNFACHAVSLSWSVRLITADFPGRARQVVEQLTGSKCFFLQGGCGNINPFRMEPDFDSVRQQGTVLGCAAMTAWEGTTPAADATLAISAETLNLPAMSCAREDVASKQVAELEKALAEQKESQAGAGKVYWTERRLNKARERLDSLRTGKPLKPVVGEVQALRLGPAVLASAPGEIFNEIGRGVKDRSPAPGTLFLGYTNGYLGYVPVPQAYAEGGYEVTHACSVDPQAAAMIEEGCLRCIKAVTK